MFVYNMSENYVIRATQTDWHNEQVYLCDTVMFHKWTLDINNAQKLFFHEAQKILDRLNFGKQQAHDHLLFLSGLEKNTIYEIVEV